MKKFKNILIIVSVVCCLILLVGITRIYKRTNYQNFNGYVEYIADKDTGSKYATYFGTECSMISNRVAYKYYKKNSRRVGNYLITDYEDGVCINRYYGHKSTIDIPETLDGKPVVKLGGYAKKSVFSVYYDVLSAFSGIENCTLNIPSSIKYIDSVTLRDFSTITSKKSIKEYPHIVEINVDKNNEHYYSDDGVLFTKDKKTLLFYAQKSYYYLDEDKDFNTYKVPDYVENFAPYFGLDASLNLEFGKNIKEIDAFFCIEDDGVITDVLEFDTEFIKEYEIVEATIKGYKGTVAEEWAEKYHAEFIPLD